jgi:hypothetical protein
MAGAVRDRTGYGISSAIRALRVSAQERVLVAENSYSVDLGLGKLLTPLAVSIGKLVTAFQPPAEELAGLAQDQFAWWRYNNTANKVRRAKDLARDASVLTTAVAPSFLLPWLSGASVVDDPDLSEMWSQLLASAAADARHSHPAFTKALERMSGPDAKFLTTTIEQWTPEWRGHLLRLAVPFEPFHDEAARLASLGIFESSFRFCDDPPEPNDSTEPRGLRYCILTFGWQFVRAVLPKVDSRLQALYPGRRVV